MNASTDGRPESARSFGLASIGPIIGLIAGTLLTVAMWVHVENLADRSREQNFEQRISHASLAIDRVLGDITGLLATVRTVIENEPVVSSEEFEHAMADHGQRLFVSGLQYVALARASRAGRCLASAPETAAAPAAMLAPGCLSVVNIYPQATNEAVVGPMLATESPERAEAMTRAMDFGYVAYTPPLGVAEDNIASPGLIAYLPAYQRGGSLATVAGRRLALAGLAVAAFSFEDLLRAELGGEFFRHIDMDILDTGLVGRPVDDAAQNNQVLDGHSLVRRIQGERAEHPSGPATLTRTIERQHAGRNWQITFSQSPPPLSVMALRAPHLVLLLGGLLTALLYAYLRTLAQRRKKAELLAERMTHDLRERQRQLRQALDAAEMGTWSWRRGTQSFHVDNRAADLLGTLDGPIENLFERVHAKDREPVRMAFRRSVRDGRPFHAECRLERAAQSDPRWVELSAQLTLGRDGELDDASGLVRNVTERYRLIHARRELMNKLITTEEKERRRIARELHDQLGQEVTAISLGLRNLQEMISESDDRRDLLAKLKGIASDIDNRIDRFTLDLRPVVLDDLGLAEALKAQFADWSTLHGIQVNSHLAGLPSAPLPFELSTTIFRVIQESLTNVARHANASAVDVIVECNGSEIKIVVEDNGSGQVNPPGNQSQGLAGMRERVEALGGQFRTETSAGNGFSIFARVPVNMPADNLVQP